MAEIINRITFISTNLLLVLLLIFLVGINIGYIVKQNNAINSYQSQIDNMKTQIEELKGQMKTVNEVPIEQVAEEQQCVPGNNVFRIIK